MIKSLLQYWQDQNLSVYDFKFVNIRISFIIITLLLNGCTSFQKKNTKNLPNIVIILADDLGWNDVGFHNIHFKTPNIDKLVKESLELNRFYTYFNCTPTRAGLLTGLYPGRLGLSGRVIGPKISGGLKTNVANIAKSLAELGYEERACIGKWHLGHSSRRFHPINQGFSFFYGHYGGQIDYFTHIRSGQLDWHQNFEVSKQKGYSTNLISEQAIKFILNANEDSPFFLYVPYNAPHTPLQAKKEDLNSIGRQTDSDYNSRNYQNLSPREKRELYKAVVFSMDQGIGDILRAIEAKGIAEETIVIFLSDNGGYKQAGASNKPLRGEKGKFYEGGIRVPACIRYPAEIKQASKSNQVASFVDLYPTILDLLGSRSKTELDGISLRPLFENPDADLNREYYYVGRNAIIKGKWKLVNRQLFNIESDQNEKKDVSNKFPEIYTELNDKLEILRREVEKQSALKEGFVVQPNWEMPE